MTKKVLVFASGNGSNFEAIVKYFYNKGLTCIDGKTISDAAPQVIFELLCDKKEAYVLKRAENLGIRCFYVKFDTLVDFLTQQKGEHDLFVLAGFMRILPEKILKTIAPVPVINIHPSLLPKFKGKDAIERAFREGVKKTGVTVHYAAKNVDSGKIIEQREVQTAGLSLDGLEARIHSIEHSMYPEIIEKLLFKRRVLVFGGGARENAIAAKIKKSPYLDKLFLAGANDGFKNLGENIEFIDYNDLLKKALTNGVDMLVVGPENPLCEGIADIFNKEGINVIGVNKYWAQLEGSKIFAKKFMQKHGIKTADYKVVTAESELLAALKDFKKRNNIVPPVIKADGLALGKGVSVPDAFDEAESIAKSFLEGKFGKASSRIILEERLSGVEVSIMSLWDGDTLVSFPPASDYKRLLDDNRGENTGGMGAYAPSKISIKQKKQVNKYLKVLQSALQSEKADFTGVLYSGLMLTENGVYVLEYNVRFGDPEIQALLELLDDTKGADLLDIFIKMGEKRLNEVDLKFKRTGAYCVTLASSGYPENPEKGAQISGINSALKQECKVYFAGVKNDCLCQAAENCTSALASCNLVTNSGRVLSLVKSGKNARDIVYRAAETIKYKGKIFRKDIGL